MSAHIGTSVGVTPRNPGTTLSLTLSLVWAPIALTPLTEGAWQPISGGATRVSARHPASVLGAWLVFGNDHTSLVALQAGGKSGLAPSSAVELTSRTSVVTVPSLTSLPNASEWGRSFSAHASSSGGRGYGWCSDVLAHTLRGFAGFAALCTASSRFAAGSDALCMRAGCVLQSALNALSVGPSRATLPLLFESIALACVCDSRDVRSGSLTVSDLCFTADAAGLFEQ